MKNKIPSMQTLLQNYFLERMIQQRKVSPETIHSYRDTFRLYLLFMQEQYHISPEKVQVEHFDIEYLTDFCKFLEEKRGKKNYRK